MDLRFSLPKTHTIVIVLLVLARDKKGSSSSEEAEAGSAVSDPEELDSLMKLLAKPTLSPD